MSNASGGHAAAHQRGPHNTYNDSVDQGGYGSEEESQPLQQANGSTGGTMLESSEAEEYLEDEDPESNYDLSGRFIDRDAAGNGRGGISLAQERWKRRVASQSWSASFQKMWHIAREALPILVLSLFSLMLSGELLVHLARWPVFVKVDKLFILVPILLNMKGNLEMNLSLRLSTSANIGELDVRRTRQALVFGNMALLQVQALIVSTFAGTLAFILGLVLPTEDSTKPTPPQKGTPRAVLLSAFGKVAQSRLMKRRIIHGHPKPPTDPSLKLRNGYFEFVLVLATGTLSASISSAVLGSFMCALVILSRRHGVNPDNVASPLAASLGDLLTLVLMGLLGSFLVRFEGTILATLILGALIAFCIACFTITWRNLYVKQLLSSGWTPLIVAMFVSSGAGLVLDSFVQKYEGFALLAPVMTGLPGACTAIFASRISTALHSSEGATLTRDLQAKHHPHYHGKRSHRFWLIPTEGWLVPVTLGFIGISISSVYITMVWWTQQMSFGWPFGLCFIGMVCVTVVIALSLSHFLCLFLWTRDFDPDIYCLPFVSSLVDVLGQVMLVCAFATASSFGDHITSVIGHADP